MKKDSFTGADVQMDEYGHKPVWPLERGPNRAQRRKAKRIAARELKRQRKLGKHES